MHSQTCALPVWPHVAANVIEDAWLQEHGLLSSWAHTLMFVSSACLHASTSAQYDTEESSTLFHVGACALMEALLRNTVSALHIYSEVDTGAACVAISLDTVIQFYHPRLIMKFSLVALSWFMCLFQNVLRRQWDWLHTASTWCPDTAFSSFLETYSRKAGYF